jgi:RHS repeat-associated protein
MALGVSVVGMEVFPARAAEPWAGLLDVTVDRPVVDAANGKAQVRVVPSVKVASPFSLSLYDTSTGTRVAYCAGSASAACRSSWAVDVTVPLDSEKTFEVFVATEQPAASYPVKDLSAQAQVTVVNVGWTGALSVAVDRPVVDAFNGKATVSVTPSVRVVSPYSMSLYDGAGKRVGYCLYTDTKCRDGWDITVSVANGQSQTYTAYVAQDRPATEPPVKDVKVSGQVQVTNRGWVGGLEIDVDRPVVDAFNGKANVTVKPSIPLVAPYSLSLYDDSTGKRVAYCAASNKACADAWVVAVTVPNGGDKTFTAYVAAEYPSGNPPAKDVRVSGSVRIVNEAWQGTLEAWADRPVVDAVDPKATVEAKTSLPLVAPYVLSVYDSTTGRRVAYCQASNNACADVWRVSVTVPNDTMRRFEVFVAADNPTTGPPVKDVRASATVQVSNEGWKGSVDVTADRDVVDVVNPQAQVTVVPSVKLASPYVLSVYDDTGKRIGYCSGSSASCRDKYTVKVTPGEGQLRVYTAYVAQDYPSSGRPVKDVRVSGSVQVRHAGWDGTLELLSAEPRAGAAKRTVDVEVKPSKTVPHPYVLSVYDSSGKRVWICERTDCRSGGKINLNVQPGELNVLYGFVALTAPADGPPADGVSARAELGVSREAWSGEVTGVVEKYLNPSAGQGVEGYQSQLKVSFSPALPADVRAALYGPDGKRVAEVTVGAGTGMADWRPVVPSPAADQVFTVVVAPDLPETALPETRWGLGTVAVSGSQRRWQGEVTLASEGAGQPGGYRVTVGLSEDLGGASIYRAGVVDGTGKVWLSCGVSAAEPACAKGFSGVVDVPAHATLALRGFVGLKADAGSGPGADGSVVYSEPVELTGEAWTGSLAFKTVGSVDAAKGTVEVEAQATPALPSGDWIVIYGHDGRAAARCQASRCAVELPAGVSPEPWLFTAAVVMDGTEDSVWPLPADRLVVSRTLEVANSGSGSGIALTADTGARGVVDSADPAVNVTVSLAEPVPAGSILLACNQSGTKVYSRAPGSSKAAVWTDTSFRWTIAAETTGVLTVGVVASGAACTALAQTAKVERLNVEHIGYGGEIILTGVQPTPTKPQAKLNLLLTRPIGVGYLFEIRDLDTGRALYTCSGADSRSSCVSRLTHSETRSVAPLTTSRFRVDVRRADSDPATARKWSSQVFEATHPGWNGSVSLSVPAAVFYSGDDSTVTMVLSEPLGDAWLALCSEQVFDQPRPDPRSRYECRRLHSTADPSGLVYRSSGGISYGGRVTYQAFVYYGIGNVNNTPSSPGSVGQAESGTATVTNGGWRGTIDVIVRYAPDGDRAMGLNEPGEHLAAYWTPAPGDAWSWAYYRRVVYRASSGGMGPTWHCDGYSWFECESLAQDSWGRIFRLGGAYMAAVHENTKMYGFPDGPAVGESAWASLPQEELPEEYLCGANPSVEDSVACQGDPVSTATGEWWETSEDLAMGGVGPGLAWTRSFSTFDRDYAGPLGKGWRSNLDMRLQIGPATAASSSTTLQTASKVRVVQENGSVADFTRGSDGRLASLARVRADLEQTPTGFVFTRRDNQRFLFDTNGRLTALEDLNGNRVEVKYDSSGRLTGVADTEGRFISLTYSSGRVSQAKDQAGRTVVYTYDSAGRMTKATGWDGTITSYAYDSEGRVAKITQPTGGTYSNTYDALDRVVSQSDPAGGVTRFAYDDIRDATTTTHPDGSKTLEEFSNFRLVRVTEGYGTDLARSISYGYQDFAASRISSETDSAGNITRYTYDQEGRVLTVTDPTGALTQAFYDQAGHLTKTTDAEGVATLTTFDQAGNMTGVTDALGNSSVLAINPDGTVGSVTAADGGSQTLAYDRYGYPVGGVSAEGVSSTRTVDSVGRVLTETSPEGLVTSYSYNARGFLTQAKGPDELSVVYTYHASGLPATVMDRLGNMTSYAYDTSGRVVSVTGSDGIVVRYTYDPVGQVVKETAVAPGGAGERAVAYAYDVLGQLVAVTDPLGRVTKYGYDQAGNQIWEETPSGARTGYQYDKAGRVIMETSPSGLAVTYSYDRAGRLVGTADPEGRFESVAYTKTGLVERQTSGQGLAGARNVLWTYDKVGRPVNVRDGDGRDRGTSYDLDGRPVAATDPAAGGVVYAYDAAGRPRTVESSNGVVVSYAYDSLGRTAKVSYSDATPDVVYTYNSLSQVTGVSDGTSYTYDNLGRVTAVATAQGRVGYVYDGWGQVARMVYPDGREAGYAYDLAGQLTKVTGLDGSVFVYTYDLDGRVESLSYPNGVVTRYTYDPDSAVTGIVTTGPDGKTVLDLQYGYSDSGLVDSAGAEFGDGLADSTVGFGWDALGQLKGVSRDGGPRAPVSFTAGGSVTGLDTGLSLAYEKASGRLSSSTGADGQVTAYSYDQVGNRVTETVDGGVAREFAWDGGGRLTGVEGADGMSAAYTYSSDGLLATAVRSGPGGVAASGSSFVWDQSREVPVILADGEHSFVYGLGLVPLEQVPAPGGNSAEPAGGNAVGTAALFLHADLVGSVRAVTNSGGVLVAGSDYTLFGEPVTVDGLAPSWMATPFGFAGEWRDPVTGLVFLRARWLDPGTGQFISVDPAAGLTGDGYGYGSGNPVQLTDPLGLWSVFGWDIDLEAVGKSATNFVYGAADSLTGGLVSAAVEGFGWDSEWLDRCSDAFKWGEVAEMAFEVVSMVVSMGATAPGVAAKFALKLGMKKASRDMAGLAGRRGLETGARAGARKLDDAVPHGPRTVRDKAPSSGSVKRPGGCANKGCFGAGTDVLLVDGSARPIEDVGAGGEVAALDVESGVVVGGEVVDTYVRGDAPVLVVGTVPGELVTTADHPFWVESDASWVSAAELVVGDVLRGVDGVLVPVVSLTVTGGTETVYNLQVEGLHNYFVYAGDTPLLVHNANGAPCPNVQPTGGVYVLRNDAGDVVRTGRTNDLARRKGEHALGKETKGLDFKVVHRTDDYAEQRGLEEIVYNQHPGALHVNGGLNRIRPVSGVNPKAGTYRSAAQKFLAGG